MKEWRVYTKQAYIGDTSLTESESVLVYTYIHDVAFFFLKFCFRLICSESAIARARCFSAESEKLGFVRARAASFIALEVIRDDSFCFLILLV